MARISQLEIRENPLEGGTNTDIINWEESAKHGEEKVYERVDTVGGSK